MPRILNVYETLEQIREGCSISRYGDGEMIFIYKHGGIKTQPHHKKLEKRLIAILEYKQPLPNHLVCIPDFFDFGERDVPYASKLFRPKRWAGIARQYSPQIPETGNLYGSSFVFRPEIFAIDYKEYYAAIQDIFTGKNFIVVGNPHAAIKTFTKETDMHIINTIKTPKTNAFRDYSKILAQCKKVIDKDAIFLVSMGASAKALTYDLCAAGAQALDTGNFFKVFSWYKKGILR